MKRFESYTALAGAITVLFGLMWTVGKPHAEGFVTDTVNDRISAIEQQLEEVQDQLQKQEYDNILLQSDTATLKSQGRLTQDNLSTILKILREPNIELE